MMVKKLFYFGIAAGFSYLMVTNPEFRKRIVKGLERGKILALEMFENAKETSINKEQELTEQISQGIYNK